MKSHRETASSEPNRVADQFTDLMRDVTSLVEHPNTVTVGDLAKLLERLRGEFAMADAVMQRQLLPRAAGASEFDFLAEAAEIEPLEAEQIATLAGCLSAADLPR